MRKQQAKGALAVIYARYSSSAQNDASIEQQVAECEEYARRNSLTIVATYADRAMSGRSDRRPEFQRMMKAAEKEQFQYVIAYKSNRIARNMLHALAYEAKLSDHGIDVVYVKEEFGNNAAGRFALRNMMNLNQFFSENLSEDVVRGLRDGASQCRIMSHIPYGYTRGDDGKFAADEKTAPIVQEVFTRYASGDTFAEIARSLNARGITTANGCAWGKNSFQTMIINKRYTGVYIYDDIRVEGGMPVIVEQELFDKVQERVNAHKTCNGRRRKEMDYLLTGKLYCGKCGKHMVGMSGTSKLGTVYHYYTCQEKRKGCKKKNVRQDAIENAAITTIQDQLLTDENIAWMADIVMEYQKSAKEHTQLAYYQDKLIETKRAITNIMKAIEAGIFTSSTKDRLEELEAEEKTLKANISVEKAKTSDLTRDMIIFYLEHFRNGNVDDPAFRKQLIDSFVSAIFLFDDRFTITFDYAADEKKNSLSAPIALEDIASASDDECSYKDENGVLKPAYTNTAIRMIKGKFVYTVHFSE